MMKNKTQGFNFESIQLDDEIIKKLDNLSQTQLENLRRVRYLLGKSKKLPHKNPGILVLVFGDILEKWLELLKIKEIEETKRKLIDAEIEKIKQATVLFIKTFNEIFEKKLEERKKILDAFMKAYNKALEQDNWEAVISIGGQIVDLLSKPILTKEEMDFIENSVNKILSKPLLKDEFISTLQASDLPDFIEI